MERVGLIGAMPMGGRWRSQGYIDGNTKYLGTYDTEDEAHQVFMREKERVQAEREKEAAVEVDRILAGPTYVYEGGKGRGASLNGTRFKIVEAHGPHQAVVVPLDSSGLPEFAAQTKVSLAYLTEVTETAPPAPVVPAPAVKVAASQAQPSTVAVDPTSMDQIKDDVLRFATRGSRHDVMWAVEFAERHARGEAATMLAVLMGQAGIERQLEWLRANTDISAEFIREVELRITSGLFMNDDARRAAKVLHREFPESYDEPSDILSSLFSDDDAG